MRHTKETCDGEVRRLKNLVTRLELELHEVRRSVLIFLNNVHSHDRNQQLPVVVFFKIVV